MSDVPRQHHESGQAVSLARFDQLLTEQQVCERYSLLVGARELRNARKRGDINYFPGKNGMALYHPDDLAAYLQRKEVKTCPPKDQPRKSFSSTADTGSPTPTARRSSMRTGMTQEADRLLDAHLRQKYSKTPKHA